MVNHQKRKVRKDIDRLEFTCTNCGKKLFRKKSIVKKNKTGIYYCDNNCRFESYKYHPELNPNFGKKHTMSKEWYDKVSPNWNKMRGKNNPNFYPKRGGYRVDLGFSVKSSWEANYARVLKYLGKEFEYEPRSIILSNGETYTPDFYIKSENKYVEIKGYFTDEAKNKIALAQTMIPLDIITEDKYLLLEKEYQDKIQWERGDCGSVLMIPTLKVEKVVSIKKHSYNRNNPKLYNLIIEGDEEMDKSFIANGIMVHNSQPHEITPRQANALVFQPEVMRFYFGPNAVGVARLKFPQVFARRVHHPGNKAYRMVGRGMQDIKPELMYVIKNTLKNYNLGR